MFTSYHSPSALIAKVAMSQPSLTYFVMYLIDFPVHYTLMCAFETLHNNLLYGTNN